MAKESRSRLLLEGKEKLKGGRQQKAPSDLTYCIPASRRPIVVEFASARKIRNATPDGGSGSLWPPQPVVQTSRQTWPTETAH